MSQALVDSSVLLDILEDDQEWYAWSADTLAAYASMYQLCINPVIYTEISIGFAQIEELEAALDVCNFPVLELPREALFLAGKAFYRYRKQKGTKSSCLPDFFIGAHAAVENLPLITRDTNRIRHYFPGVSLVCPC